MFKILGKETTATQTPTERMQILVNLIPDASEPASILLSEYEKTIYSTKQGNALIANRARVALWKRVFRYWLKRNMGKFMWRE